MRINLTPYPVPLNPEYIVFSDLDETFYCHSATEKEILAISDFEKFMESIVKEKHVLFGIVTGSSLASVIKKLTEGRFQFSPHFIACDLGTMLYWVRPNGELSPDLDWTQKLETSNFSEATVNQIVQALRENHQIDLVAQTQLGSSLFKKNYYYYMSEKTRDKQNIEHIKKLAKDYQIACNINVCNPLAGDPPNAFDVDFIPMNTGKAAIVTFLNRKFAIEKEKSIGFGDSGNDIEMLLAVGHGYLLQNATYEAKTLYKKITSYPYIKGMLSVLQERLK